MFNINDFLGEESKKEMVDNFKIEKIPACKLHPSEKNFYEMNREEIETLKETIELVGVQENLIVKKIEKGEHAGEYEIIAGHKRHRAVAELLQEGKEVSELLPCNVKTAADDVKNELILIFTNSTQRQRSDYCKMQEIQRVRELLEEYALHNELPGRKRDIIAGILNTSKTTVGRLDNIRKNIIPEFLEEYKAGNISTSAANEIAGAEPEAQEKLLEKYRENGNIKAKEAAEAKEQREEEQIPGQVEINDYDGIAPEETEEPEEEIEESEEVEEEEPEGAAEPAEPEETEPRQQEKAEVTINQTADTTDRTSLIISGQINPHKEYNGMLARFFIDAITRSDLFNTDFWHDWTDPGINKAEILQDYRGTTTSFTTTGGEVCQIEILDSIRVTRLAEHTSAEIRYRDFAELINALIFTKVVKVEKTTIDVPYWIKESAKELATLAMWGTEEELAVLQEIILQIKERANR